MNKCITKNNLVDNRGFIATTALLLTVLMATMAISVLKVQDATEKDSSAITKGMQAKFLAESALQEAKYYAVQVGNGWTGTSSEQTVSSQGKTQGTYDYTVSSNGSTYTITASGYVPNKTSRDKVTRTLTSSFSFQSIIASGGIVVLNPTAASSLSSNGNGTMTVYGGKVYVNSTSASGMSLSGNGGLSASEFDLAGNNYSHTGNSSATGTIKLNQTPIADPFATLAVPDPATMVVRQNSVLSIGNNTTVTLDPGVYVGGISMSGNAVVTMNPGVYYLKTGTNGKGLTISGNATLTGNQVIIYNEAVGANEGFSLSGNGAITLTPPTSGTYKYVLYFQSRTSTRASTITGNGQLRMRGDLYLKTATLNVSGNGSNVGSLYVADKVVMSGNGNVSVNNY